MAGIFDCGICDNTYNETERKPLVLLCGHTYCQQCLQNVVAGTSPACPSCRKEIVSPVNELPVIFALIPPANSDEMASSRVVNKESSCSAHQNELDYWCTQCQILICKQCLVEAHGDHKFTLTEKMIGDKRLLSDKKDQIVAELQRTKTFVETLRQLESMAGKIDEKKNDILIEKNSMLKKQLILTEWVNLLEAISSEPSQTQISVMLKILKYQTQAQTEVNISDSLREIHNWVSQFKMSTKPDEKPDNPFETYLHDGQPWNIISNELAKNALFTMKETDHKTPKAIVKSTDEDTILCLPQLLQYLATSSTSLELQLMDRSKKEYPEKKDWFPLMAGGAKSTNFNHCYRLKVLMDPLIYFQSLTAVTTTFGQVMNDSSQNKVIALLYPGTHTYDVCVLAYGKILKSDAGSWPLPLEVHVIGLTAEHWLWVKCSLPILYSMAQPKMGECRVYLPKFNGAVDLNTLFSFMAELGKTFTTQNRVYLPGNIYNSHARKAAEAHKVTLDYSYF